MTKNHEELVEEIASLATAHRRGVFTGHIGDFDLDFAKEAITLILSAVRDGLEIPGEVGRIKEMQAVPSIWCQRMCKKGAAIFIALRPLTGKEEEK